MKLMYSLLKYTRANNLISFLLIITDIYVDNITIFVFVVLYDNASVHELPAKHTHSIIFIIILLFYNYN